MGYYEFDKKLEDAYSSIISLHFSKAELLLGEEKTEKPNNELVQLYSNYIDFLTAFISEDIKDFDILKKNTTKRIEGIVSNKGNSSSPFHLYVQAEMYIQLALVRIKFQENILSANEIYKAYKLIKRNEKLFPSFPLNKKISGLLNVVIGAVPSQYQWLTKFAGLQGSISVGLNELNEDYRNLELTEFKAYRTELLFYLGNIYSAFSLTPDSNNLLELMKPNAFENPLISYVYSGLLMKQGKNDDAIAIINNTLKSKSTYPLTVLYYKRGLARLRSMDFESSDDFSYFLNHYKGANHIKSSFQKLAWIFLIRGDTINYKNQLSHCTASGSILLEEDQEAYHEALSGDIPNVFLLKSRLYFDGGYYNQSLLEISGRKIEQFPRYKDQLEVTYRLGRIMQMTEQINKAIIYFEMSIKNGSSSRLYYAANSSLQLGLIYEERNDYEKARSYFRKCLSMEISEYKNSINQKANAGLDRIKNIKVDD